MSPMLDAFKKEPLAVLAAWGVSVLAILSVLQGSGILTGTAAHWADIAAGVLQVVLTAYARQKVTPVADPMDNIGNALVPAGARYEPTKP